jgi:hypothetical protein
MLNYFRKLVNSAPSEPFVSTPDWEDAIATPTEIDVAEFEAAHNNPEWLAFCERADEYVASAESIERELQAH